MLHLATGPSSNAHIDETMKCVVDTNTSSAPPGEQFGLFCSWHSDIAAIELLREEHDSFQARERVWHLGDIAFAVIECPGSAYPLRWRHKKKPVLDHWLLSLLLSESRRKDGAMEAGKLSMRCLAAQEECQSQDDAILALFLPRNLISVDSCKVEVRQEARMFLTEYLLLLHRSLSELRPQDIPHIAAATTNLLTACLSPSADHVTEARGPISIALLRRASTIIMERLADQHLTPDQLCRELGISRSGLYRIFEPVGGIANYIRRKRLRKTRDMLADSSDQRSISSIAEEWGFTDPSTYSRMFRKEFGISPREAREEGWRGNTQQWLPVDLSIDKPLTLNSVLLSSY